jgi:hypothetical protein
MIANSFTLKWLRKDTVIGPAIGEYPALPEDISFALAILGIPQAPVPILESPTLLSSLHLLSSVPRRVKVKWNRPLGHAKPGG